MAKTLVLATPSRLAERQHHHGLVDDLFDEIAPRT